MTDLNRGTIVGRLTKDGEISYTQAGTAVLKCSLANNYSKKVDGKWEDVGQFFEFTLWGTRAEGLVPYLKKGSRVGIEYQLRQDRWETPEGVKRYKVHLHADQIQLLDSKPQEKPDGAPEFDPSKSPKTMAERDGWSPEPATSFEDDIPAY